MKSKPIETIVSDLLNQKIAKKNEQIYNGAVGYNNGWIDALTFILFEMEKIKRTNQNKEIK